MHPYTLVKDHRTSHSETNVERVLDGGIDGYVVFDGMEVLYNQETNPFYFAASWRRCCLHRQNAMKAIASNCQSRLYSSELNSYSRLSF